MSKSNGSESRESPPRSAGRERSESDIKRMPVSVAVPRSRLVRFAHTHLDTKFDVRVQPRDSMTSTGVQKVSKQKLFSSTEAVHKCGCLPFSTRREIPQKQFSDILSTLFSRFFPAGRSGSSRETKPKKAEADSFVHPFYSTAKTSNSAAVKARTSMLNFICDARW